MISELAYNNGVSAAWGTFLKTSNVPITSFAKKGLTAPPALKPAATGMHMAGAAPGAPTVSIGPAAGGTNTGVVPAPAAPMAPPITGGAAAPAPAAPAAAAPAKPGFMDSWKGQLAMNLGVPLAMGAVQNMMTPAPKDPNGL